MESIAAIALAGGKGVRARPITLNSPDYLRSKAVMQVAGQPLIEWAVTSLRSQGVHRYYVVANGRENRAQTKGILAHGERHGITVRYSRTRFDHENTGSGEATLRCLDYWDLTGLALVFPTDSLFDFDLGAMVRAHRAARADVTVATVPRPGAEAAGKYGVLELGPGNQVGGFLEKPSLAVIRSLTWGSAGDPVHTNAGMYLIDCDRLRMAAREPDLAALARRQLDWGGDLLPYLVRRGHRVLAHPIARFGDLGSPRDYLETLKDVLLDRYPRLSEQLGRPAGPGGGHRVHPSSLEMKDQVSGRTLAEKIEDGSVRIGPGVRIGRDVEIGPGVMLVESDIGDGVDIGEQSTLRGVACGDHSIVGPGARLTDVILGSMVDVRSTLPRPVVLDDYCALGDEVRVRPGTRLRGVSVFPRLEIGDGIPRGASLSDVRDLLRCL
ncbi:sugar phosphate nucleotidyltransferase [Streptomyces sp. NPDC007264]|uniref:sugar phosphate nucleotidyltransferase n=1 Tax=Streptomyces sp. NPDC007264 TaxID=3364777 RepID=UPI0036D8143D